MRVAHSVPVLEIGGTHVSAALVDTQDWSVSGHVRHDVDAHGSAGEIIAAFAGAAATLGVADGSRWGVAMPDPFDYASGIARFRDVGKYEAIDGLDMGRALAEALGLSPNAFSALRRCAPVLLNRSGSDSTASTSS